MDGDEEWNKVEEEEDDDNDEMEEDLGSTMSPPVTKAVEKKI